MRIQAPKCQPACPKRAPERHNARPHAPMGAQASKWPAACPNVRPGAKIPARAAKCPPACPNTRSRAEMPARIPQMRARVPKCPPTCPKHALRCRNAHPHTPRGSCPNFVRKIKISNILRNRLDVEGDYFDKSKIALKRKKFREIARR